MQFRVAEIASLLGGDLPLETAITGWCVDSRTVRDGDLFFALRGATQDGNVYVPNALASGAVAAVAETSGPGPVIVVQDSLRALQDVAAWARVRWGREVVGITGSAGKTSTKDIIAAMLSSKLRVGKTEGNFNNHVGVPLSLLRIPGDSEVAVLEIGMNHAGEIAQLCLLARPRIGVVTNVGYAHIENFESVEGIANAKRELIDSLPPDGVAVLNADDPYVSGFRAKFAGKVVTFGLGEAADVRATDVRFSDDGVDFNVNAVRFRTTLSGRHAVLNILAGIAVAGEFGIEPAQLRDPVAQLRPGKMRGERFTRDGFLILNDSYNANPEAMRAMIDVLRDAPGKRKIAVLGEMLELGRFSDALHRDVGRYAAEAGIRSVIGIRGAARSIVEEAKAAGLPPDAAVFFDDAAEAGLFLRQFAREGDAILFKGSRGTRVEQALDNFLLQSR